MSTFLLLPTTFQQIRSRWTWETCAAAAWEFCGSLSRRPTFTEIERSSLCLQHKIPKYVNRCLKCEKQRCVFHKDVIKQDSRLKDPSSLIWTEIWHWAKQSHNLTLSNLLRTIRNYTNKISSSMYWRGIRINLIWMIIACRLIPTPPRTLFINATPLKKYTSWSIYSSFVIYSLAWAFFHVYGYWKLYILGYFNLCRIIWPFNRFVCLPISRIF